MFTLKTRDAARAVARTVNAANTGAKLKAAVKEGAEWVFPGLTHNDGKGVLSLKK